MGERLLIVGGNGFIGSHLVDALSRTGVEVGVLDRQEALFIPRLPGVAYHIADCADRSALNAALRGCGTVVHMAHSSSPVISTDAPADDVLNSMEGFTTLVECARNAGVGRFVLFSSGGAVYGIPDRNPVDETRAERPISPYGVSKVCMEQYLRMYSRTYDLPHLIVRPSNAYGPRQNYRGRQGLIAISIYRILTDQPISVWGNGTTAKDYLYVDDLIQGTLALLASPIRNETFNLGSGQSVSIAALLDIICAVCGKKAEVVHEPLKAVDVHDIALDCGKIRRHTGWGARCPVEEGIERTCRWIRQELRKGERE